jgi:2-epi-5-epi-valiolone synthase
VAGLRWERAGGYQVSYASGLLTGRHPDAARRLAARLRSRRVLVVSTPSVAKLYGESLEAFCAGHAIRADILVIDRTEATKGPDAVLEVAAAAAGSGLGRDDLIVAFGGGICCDVVTVAAAGYRRGIGYLCLPTTLIAQIDAGIGLKGAVNLGRAKSRWGTFHPPEAVFADPQWLASLDRAAIRHGGAEMIKVAAVADRELFDRLELELPRLVGEGTAALAPALLTGLLERSATAALDQLALNPFERPIEQDGGTSGPGSVPRGGAVRSDRTRLLDFGHTFSPVLEECSDWTVPHGEAVAVDVVLSCRIGVALGVTPSDVHDRVERLVSSIGLPTGSPWLTAAVMTDAVDAAVAHRGSLHLVVPGSLGEARYLESVPADLFTQLG